MSSLGAQKRADLEAEDHRGQTPLHFAVNRDNVDVVRLLLTSGANITAKDRSKATPLHLAVDHDSQLEMAKLLLGSVKVDVNAVDACGRTPLRKAIERRSRGIIELFLSSEKVDGNTMNSNGGNIEVGEHFENY